MNSPFILTIFGGTGDLAQNKLFPALFSLYKHGLLGERFFVVGFSRRSLSDAEYRDFICKTCDKLKTGDTVMVNNFIRNVYYQQGFFDNRDGYDKLIPRLSGFDTETGACITRIFYLATPPDNYEHIINNLAQTKLSEGCGLAFTETTSGRQIDGRKLTRIAIEKPFGKDLETARNLDIKLSEIFEEKQIFRVDHYLGKDTLQNMLAFRFANGIFDPVWNNNYIDHVQITASETSDVSTRGKFFDGVGNLRDWGQNHLMQIAASVVMEQPQSFTKESVRDVRAAALGSIRPITPGQVPEMVVRGQYEGYRLTKDVDPDSNTETFVAFKMFFDTPRFMDIPFYLRAGKNMMRNDVEINIVLKQTCHLLFKEYGCPEIGNVLRIRLDDPNEGIGIRVIAKKPSAVYKLDTVDLSFNYRERFGKSGSHAYPKLLLDILTGDQMLFNRSDELESTWEFITEILKGWDIENKSPHWKIPGYKPGSWGPQEGIELIEKDGRKWII